MIHLDTSFLIQAMVPSSGADRCLRGWLREGADLAISAIAWAEFRCGPLGDLEIDIATTMVGDVVSYTAVDAEATAGLFNAGGRRRGSLADCMIAAIALRAGASLATANPRDFRRFAPEALTIIAP